MLFECQMWHPLSDIIKISDSIKILCFLNFFIFTFKSMIQLTYIFVHGFRKGSVVFFQHKNPIAPVSFIYLKKQNASFSYEIAVISVIKQVKLQAYNISRFYILPLLCLQLNYCSITAILEICFYNRFLLFKTCLALLGSLHFNANFRISLLISIIKHHSCLFIEFVFKTREIW